MQEQSPRPKATTKPSVPGPTKKNNFRNKLPAAFNWTFPGGQKLPHARQVVLKKVPFVAPVRADRKNHGSQHTAKAVRNIFHCCKLQLRAHMFTFALVRFLSNTNAPVLIGCSKRRLAWKLVCRCCARTGLPSLSSISLTGLRKSACLCVALVIAC